MRKIAIITTGYQYCGCDYGGADIIKSITNWEEVDDQTFNDLMQASWGGDFKVIEQPVDQKEFILNTVTAYKEKVAAQKAAEEARKAEEQRKKTERALKKKAKTEEAEKALLAELLKKHGGA